jgi:predicted small secreted protein
MKRLRSLRLAIVVAAAGVVAGCATVPTSDVTVVNARENPALVRMVAPGYETFQYTASITNTIDVSIFTVPPDRRLLIEFVSGFCNTTQGVPVQTVRLSGSVDHFFTPHVFPTGTGTSFAVITQDARIYANPTAIVKLAVFPTSNSSTTTCSISLSGRMMTP